MKNLPEQKQPLDLDAAVKRLEAAKKQTSNGVEYWRARDIQMILDYGDWKGFLNVVDKAKTSCSLSGQQIENHFGQTTKLVGIGSDTERRIPDIFLTRYACYLIAMNGRSSKDIIATAQSYFAVQTRLQEIEQAKQTEHFKSDDEKRLFLRKEVTEQNKELADAAHDAGVTTPIDHAIFQNFGYKGQYGGLTAKDRHKKMGLKKSQSILDHMGSTELASNLFRATQTKDKLKKDNVKDKHLANKTHFDVGVKVRKAIIDIGGTNSEDLPTEPHIKEIEKRVKAKELSPPKE